MNYYGARQRQKDKRWDFTIMNNGHVSPTGYCHAWSEWPDDLKSMASLEYRQYVTDKDKYHGEGHENKEDAERCYYRYVLDTKLRPAKCPDDEQHKCEIPDCGKWTQAGLQADSAPTWLCEAHGSRADYERLHPFEPGHTIISSW
jgi:hypothetical protein